MFALFRFGFGIVVVVVVDKINIIMAVSLGKPAGRPSIWGRAS